MVTVEYIHTIQHTYLRYLNKYAVVSRPTWVLNELVVHQSDFQDFMFSQGNVINGRTRIMRQLFHFGGIRGGLSYYS